MVVWLPSDGSPFADNTFDLLFRKVILVWTKERPKVKIKFNLATLLLIMSVTVQTHAGMTTTQSYKLTLTIPESAGSQAALTTLTFLSPESSMSLSSHELMMVQETIRDREKIVLQSFVTK